MVRSDHSSGIAARREPVREDDDAQLPGALSVVSTLPFVGRSAELERLRALLPRAQGEDLRVALVGGEAGVGQEPARARVRRGGGRRRRARALRRLRRGRATPYGAFAEALDPLVSLEAVGELRRSCCRPARALAPVDPRHGASSPPHGRRRPARTRDRAAAGAARARGRALGGRRDAPAAAPPGARRAARGCCCSPPSETRRPRCPRRSAETLADLRRHDVMRLRLSGLSEARWPSSCAAPAGTAPSELPPAIRRAHRGQRVPGLRAVAGADRDGSDPARRRGDPDPPPPGGARQPRRACARS